MTGTPVRKNAMKEKAKRDGNFELLRIISMVMIVSLHYLKKGRLLTTDIGSGRYYFAWALEALCFVAVNLFVLISGYYLNSKKFKLNRILDLWIQTFFISASLYVAARKAGIIKTFELDTFLKSFMPITRNSYWFITAYFLFLALVPFLVYTTEIINEHQHRILAVTLTFLTSVLPTVFFRSDWVRIDKGYHILWFVTLFYVASFIRKYDCFKRNPFVYFSAYFVCCGLAFAMRFAVKSVSLKLYNKDLGDAFFSRYNMFLFFLASLFLFLAFKNIKIKSEKANKLILFFSSSSVYVYIIHEAPAVRNYFWEKIIMPQSYKTLPDMLLNYCLTVSAVYIACTLAGKAVVYIYRLLRLDKLTVLISNRLFDLTKRVINRKERA